MVLFYYRPFFSKKKPPVFSKTLLTLPQRQPLYSKSTGGITMEYTVKALAELAGVTPRTLR